MFEINWAVPWGARKAQEGGAGLPERQQAGENVMGPRDNSDTY